MKTNNKSILLTLSLILIATIGTATYAYQGTSNNSQQNLKQKQGSNNRHLLLIFLLLSSK